MDSNMLYLLNDAIKENDNISDKNFATNTDIDINTNNIIIDFNNFEYSKNKIKYYLERKREKLYNKLFRFYDIFYNDIFYKKLHIEYLNDIYYFYKDIVKQINEITFEDNFEYKFNIEMKNNIKYKYNLIYTNIKLRL